MSNVIIADVLATVPTINIQPGEDHQVNTAENVTVIHANTQERSK